MNLNNQGIVSKMQNGNTKIRDLFNGDRIFNIPKYQRAYAWEEENLEYFLDDLKNQRNKKSYFLGTFLLHEKPSRGDYEFVDVVDGQQRLTTIIIFMKVILQKFKDRQIKKITQKAYSRYVSDGESYKLELENEDSSFLHGKNFDDDKLIKAETPSQRKLYKAKKYFLRELSKLDTDELERHF